ncbi:MAG: alpha/beta hydrolase [Lutibacter sp.]|jgi:pimeloyl-ACP methyl ester carboxylesterase|nr:alpha/beta hydrolase [Lutibacter sp.]
MPITKAPVYFVPGLAANPRIFEHIQLPENRFTSHYLTWLLPLFEQESIEDYAKRMATMVTEKDPVLVGVSFGGILVQEMAKHLSAKKVIIISSVKSHYELPNRLRFVQKTGVYKYFPVKSIKLMERCAVFALGDFAKKKVALSRKYLSVREAGYLRWAIYQVLHWKQAVPDKLLVHIHGSEDEVFPIKHIKDCVQIEGGTHAMILSKAPMIRKIIADLY